MVLPPGCTAPLSFYLHTLLLEEEAMKEDDYSSSRERKKMMGRPTSLLEKSYGKGC